MPNQSTYALVMRYRRELAAFMAGKLKLNPDETVESFNQTSPVFLADPLDVAEESLAVTCPHCGHNSDVRIPARFKP